MSPLTFYRITFFTVLMFYCKKDFSVTGSQGSGVTDYNFSFFLSPSLSSLSADEYKIFLEEREEKLKADAAEAAAAADALTGKKK